MIAPVGVGASTTRDMFAQAFLQPVILSVVEVLEQERSDLIQNRGAETRSVSDDGISFGITIACRGKLIF